MHNTQGIINQLDFNYQFTQKLVEDLSAEQMTITPYKGFENHPAFTIGHLITGTALTVEYLGGNYDVPKKWDELFRRNGPGDTRLPDLNSDIYPLKSVLLQKYKQEREKLKALLLQKSKTFLIEETQWRFSNYMPTNMDMLLFMCISHEAMHLGQLSAWRRAMNLPSALGKM